jgi:hypothetical protein
MTSVTSLIAITARCRSAVCSSPIRVRLAAGSRSGETGAGTCTVLPFR